MDKSNVQGDHAISCSASQLSIFSALVSAFPSFVLSSHNVKCVLTSPRILSLSLHGHFSAEIESSTTVFVGAMQMLVGFIFGCSGNFNRYPFYEGDAV